MPAHGQYVIVRGQVVGIWQQCRCCPAVYSKPVGSPSDRCPDCRAKEVR